MRLLPSTHVCAASMMAACDRARNPGSGLVSQQEALGCPTLEPETPDQKIKVIVTNGHSQETEGNGRGRLPPIR